MAPTFMERMRALLLARGTVHDRTCQYEQLSRQLLRLASPAAVTTGIIVPTLPEKNVASKLFSNPDFVAVRRLLHCRCF